MSCCVVFGGREEWGDEGEGGGKEERELEGVEEDGEVVVGRREWRAAVE